MKREKIINIRVLEEEKKAIVRLANSKGISVASVIRMWIRENCEVGD